MFTPPDTLTGTVRADGDAVAGAEVVLFGLAGERPEILAAGATDADGAFALPAGEDLSGPLAVLARLTGEVVGVAAVEIAAPPDGPVAIDLAGPARTVTIGVEREAGDPETLTIALEPDAPPTVSARLRPFVNQLAPGVFAGRFVTRELTGDELVLRVLPGQWRITGEFLDPNRPNMPDPGFRNVIVTGVRSDPDGAPLPGSETGGFVLEVDRDRRVSLALREVPDAEL